MKRFLAVIFLSFLVLLPSVRADGPDDDYVAIYTMIQQGDALTEKGEWGQAMTKYVAAEDALKRFQKAYPDAYIKVVTFRLNYLQSKIDFLTSKTAPATNAAPQIATNAPAPGTPATQQPSAEMQQQVQSLQEQIRHLEADRSLLEAKLKEALAARPAEVDPQELAKARQQITNLQKENDLLKANLEAAKTNVAIAAAAPADLEKTKQALADANQKVATLTDANSKLALERDALQSRVKTIGAPDAATTALREENEILKKQVAELKNKSVPTGSPDELQRKLQEAQAQIAAMQSDKEIMRVEKMALQSRLKQLTTNTPAVPEYVTGKSGHATSNAVPVPDMTDSVTASKIAQLEAQRDELQKSLDAATRDAMGRRKGKELATRIEEMTRQLASLRARIEVFEATPVPYTPEEQALFSNSEPTLTASAHSHRHKAPKEPSAAAQLLLSEAGRFYVAHEYSKAEAKYLEALKLDPKNVVVLADLADLQSEEGRLPDAEKNVKAALTSDPDDDFSLWVLGMVKFREMNYDEAFEALSHAAELNPQSPNVQDWLGLTLVKKGLRGPAETAFRKAIQLDPGFADAHMNLSVVYATQQPPLLELARWHYQKAIAAGAAPKPDFEKLLDPTRSAGK